MADAVGVDRRGIAALLFMGASMNTLDAYSTLNSSPWTAENFGADPAKAKSCREYVAHAVGYSTAYAVASSVIAGSLLPLIGATVANVYLWWLYARGLRRGAETGSAGWAKG